MKETLKEPSGVPNTWRKPPNLKDLSIAVGKNSSKDLEQLLLVDFKRKKKHERSEKREAAHWGKRRNAFIKS